MIFSFHICVSTRLFESFLCLPALFYVISTLYNFCVLISYLSLFYVFLPISFLFSALIFHICVCTCLFESFLRLPALFHVISLHFYVFTLFHVLARFVCLHTLLESFLRLPSLFHVISFTFSTFLHVFCVLQTLLESFLHLPALFHVISLHFCVFFLLCVWTRLLFLLCSMSFHFFSLLCVFAYSNHFCALYFISKFA